MVVKGGHREDATGRAPVGLLGFSQIASIPEAKATRERDLEKFSMSRETGKELRSHEEGRDWGWKEGSPIHHGVAGRMWLGCRQQPHL